MTLSNILLLLSYQWFFDPLGRRLEFSYRYVVIYHSFIRKSLTDTKREYLLELGRLLWC